MLPHQLDLKSDIKYEVLGIEKGAGNSLMAAQSMETFLWYAGQFGLVGKPEDLNLI